MKAVEGLVAVLDAPAGEADLDPGIGAVVAVAIRDEEEIRRSAEPEAVETDGDSGGKRDALEEDLA